MRIMTELVDCEHQEQGYRKKVIPLLYLPNNLTYRKLTLPEK